MCLKPSTPSSEKCCINWGLNGHYCESFAIFEADKSCVSVIKNFCIIETIFFYLSCVCSGICRSREMNFYSRLRTTFQLCPNTGLMWTVTYLPRDFFSLSRVCSDSTYIITLIVFKINACLGTKYFSLSRVFFQISNTHLLFVSLMTA